MHEIKEFDDFNSYASSMGINDGLSKDARQGKDAMLFLNELIKLSHKYGLGEVICWIEPFTDNAITFSIETPKCKSRKELWDILDCIVEEIEEFSIKNNIFDFFNESCIVYDYHWK